MAAGEARVRDFFEKKGIDKQIVSYGESTENCALAAQTLGVELGRIAKSILFLADGRPHMVVISGDKRVDEKKLKTLLASRKVRMARKEEVLEFTGFDVGGVSPVGHLTEFPIFIDVSLKRFEQIFPAAGEHYNMFPTDFNELLAMTGGTAADLARE